VIALPQHTIYFSHPINVYNTPLEDKLLRIIADTFPGWKIINPNKPEHQRGYERYGHQYGNGMKYYYTEVLPFCDKNISLPFRDGRLGAGVFGEARFIAFQHHSTWTWLILPTGEIEIVRFKEIKALSIPATRERIRDERGNILPY